MVTPARSEEELVDVWRKVVDPEYARSIEEADDAGMDVVHQQAAQLSTLDSQLVVVQQSYYLLPHSDQLAPPASGIRYATGEVLISRKDSGLGTRKIVAGTELEGHIVDSMGVDRVTGYFRTTADASLDEGDVGPVAVPVQAEFGGFSGNQAAGTITRFKDRSNGRVLAFFLSETQVQDTVDANYDAFNVSQIGQYLVIQDGVESYPRLITNVSQGVPATITVDPPFPVTMVGTTDVAFVVDHNSIFDVEQPEALSGGRDGTLDGIGADRNMPRTTGETDDAYRQRLARLEDTISPAAIVRTATRILQPLGIRFAFKETRTDVRGFVLDDSPMDTGDVCADGDPWSGSVILSENDATRFFVICVSMPDQQFGDVSTPLDATDDGVNAYDSGGPGDGGPVLYNQAIATLWRAINHAREAGVNFVIVQDPAL